MRRARFWRTFAAPCRSSVVSFREPLAESTAHSDRVESARRIRTSPRGHRITVDNDLPQWVHIVVRVADTAAVTQAKRRTFSSVAVAILAVAGLMFSDQGSSAAAGWRYTVVAFSNTSDTYMDVYQSADGSAFEPVAKPAYRPPSGRVRDPSIFRHTDGFYYVTYTPVDGANIGFARSRDRVHWSFVRNVPVPLCCAFLPGTGDGKGLGSSSGPGSSGSAGSSDGPSLSPFTTRHGRPTGLSRAGVSTSSSRCRRAEASCRTS